MYSLMHRDDPVCAITIDAASGAILRVSKPVHPELLPLGGCIDSAMLKKWWQRRAVPIGQGRIQKILEQLGVTTPQEYLVKNLGLSLTDHYWIKPYSDVELIRMRHREDEKSTGTYVTVSAFQMGIGTGICGPATRPEYCYSAKDDHVLKFIIG